MFTNRQLKDMILPLCWEQLLVMCVGLADTFVISYAGEAAVSGVSLVNSFNTIFIYLFTALASGGAVIVSQYIGRSQADRAGAASSQLLMFSGVFSGVLTALLLPLGPALLGLLFGRVEPEVMEACRVYLRISVYSYPAIAVYNAGAALYRSIGRTAVTMKISLVANAINVAGNLIGVFVLKAGVAGVAWPSFLSRLYSAVAITVLCFSPDCPVRYARRDILRWDSDLLRRILGIALPNGVESGVFQLVKVALSSVVALFGTCQIAANGIAQSFWSLAAVVGAALGPVFITVIGQCMGSGDVEQTRLAFRKLLRISFAISVGWNAAVLALTPLILRFYAVEPETKQLIFRLVLIHNCFNSVVYPISGPFSNGLRAAGDVRYTMLVSIFATVGGRLVLSFLFAITLNLGVIGIAYAMCADWCIRAVLLWRRFLSGRWERFRLV